MFEHLRPVFSKHERRRRLLVSGLAFAVLMAGYLSYELKNYPEERQAVRFFDALQRQNYQEAYRLWQPSDVYTFNDFMEDWGPNSPQGPVRRFHITGSTASGSGVVVRVLVNRRGIRLWVEKKDKSLSFPP